MQGVARYCEQEGINTNGRVYVNFVSLVKFTMDNEANDVTEEGEILDYEPLPRPTVASNLSNNCFRSDNAKTLSSDSSDSNDSDDNGVVKHKKHKIPKRGSGRNDKYHVWASQFQTSELMDEICGWETGLKNKVMDKSRAVESYYHFLEESETETETKKSDESDIRKRRHGEVVDLRSKLGQRQKKENDETKGHPRYLSELRVSPENSVDDVTQDITLKLCEEKEELVLRVVTVLGREKAIEIFNKTKSLEEEGGMMVMNGSRRRTPGGVFLQLIKKDEDVTKAQKKQIFIDDQKEGNKFKRAKAKSRSKKKSENNEAMQTENVEDLPPLLEKKELLLSLKESDGKTDNETCETSETSSPVDKEKQRDPRPLAEYDDIFDVEFS